MFFTPSSKTKQANFSVSEHLGPDPHFSTVTFHSGLLRTKQSTQLLGLSLGVQNGLLPRSSTGRDSYCYLFLPSLFLDLIPYPFTMSIRNVAIVGADGLLGPFVVKALASSKKFNVTVLKRKSSSSQSDYPPGVQTASISDNFPVDELVTALKDIDAVVITVKGSLADLQTRLADAAAQAGVKHFIPADFGSCDSQDQLACELVPLFQRKADVRKHLQNLVSQHPGFSWTSIVCGHFFDMDCMDFLHMDLAARKADILDDGETRCSATTLPQVGTAVVKILEKSGLKEIENRVIYIQSFCASQNQIVRIFERTTGQSWKVDRIDSDAFVKKEKAKAEEEGDESSENLVWVLGTLYANWEERDGFSNEVLGLKEEDLEKVVADIVAQ